MNKSIYTGVKAIILMYIVGFLFAILGIITFICTLSIKAEDVIAEGLLLLSLGVILIFISFNLNPNIEIDYDNKIVFFNTKNDNPEVKFGSILKVYECSREEAKKKFLLDKCPKKVLVVEFQNSQNLISLFWYRRKDIESLKKELMRVRFAYEN